MVMVYMIVSCFISFLKGQSNIGGLLFWVLFQASLLVSFVVLEYYK